MSSLIGEPFQVSSYPVPTKTRQEKAHHPIYVSYGHNYSDHATVTVQAEGIHVVDVSFLDSCWKLVNRDLIFQLSELHPVVSHTCGSNVTFSGPANSRCTSEDDGGICTTYAVVSSAPEVAAKNKDRTVWIMRQKISGGTLGKSEKREVVVCHAHENIPGYILH